MAKNKKSREEKRIARREKKSSKKNARAQARIERSAASPALQSKYAAANEARLAAEEAQARSAQAAKEARRASAEAARAAKESVGIVASRDAQIDALAGYLADQNSYGRRAAVDIGVLGAGAVASTAQTKLLAWALAPKPKPGETKPANWFFRNFGLTNGTVATLEGAAIYTYALTRSGENPPTVGEEAAREFGKGLFATGVYTLSSDLADRAVAWYRAYRAKRVQTQAQPPAPQGG